MVLKLKHREHQEIQIPINADAEDNFEREEPSLYSDNIQSKLNENGFTDDQQSGFNILCSGVNVCLTGNAGTGKSYLLNSYIDWLDKNKKQKMVVAPTGIAAINIGGSTIHRSFKARIGPLVDKPKQCQSTLLSVDSLICDEISMCRIDLFDYMIYQIMCANRERRKRGIKDIQLVVCGDFFQLAPVLTERDKGVLQEYYGQRFNRGYAFESEYWEACGFKNIILKQIVRQSDEMFQRNLNDARIGDVGSINYFNKRSAHNVIKGAITLSGTNKQVDEINNYELSKIMKHSTVFLSESEGDVKDSDKVAPDTLELKVGARVMSLINNPDELYQNGSLGTVLSIDDKSDEVTVEFDNGNTEVIGKYTWDIIDYSMSDGSVNRKVIGQYTQIPLKLAYAVTIHKSQGQTYDAVNLYPKSWDCGQLYVALSRCKSIDTMHLMENIVPRDMVASNKVKDFYKKLEEQ